MRYSSKQGPQRTEKKLKFCAMPSERMAYTQFQSQVVEVISALEARGHQYSQSSKAEISISELEAHQDAFYRLTRLPHQLHLTCEDETLSLAEARLLYNSSLLDTLFSILYRVPWTYFCTDLHSLVCPRGGFLVAGSAFDCIYALLDAYRRVQPPSRHASLETFGRY